MFLLLQVILIADNNLPKFNHLLMNKMYILICKIRASNNDVRRLGGRDLDRPVGPNRPQFYVGDRKMHIFLADPTLPFLH